MRMTDSGGLAGRVLQGMALGPNRIALRLGGMAYSYASIHEMALSLGGVVRGSGTRAPTRVGVLAGVTVSAYTGILAAMYAGAAAVPLNVGFPLARTLQMIKAAGLDTVIVDDHGAGLLASVAASVPEVRLVTASQDGPAATAGPALSEPVPVTRSDIAYILFTSGSTGRPKGVPISHGNVLHFIEAVQSRYQVGPADVVMQTFEPTFDLFMFGLFVPWSANAALVATPPQALRNLPAFTAKHGISVWFSVPAAIRMAKRLTGLSPGSLSSLRLSLFCGEALTFDDAAAWQAAAPASGVENLYGPTELTIACTGHRFNGIPVPGARGLVPIGKPYPGLRHLLVGDDLRPVVKEGELCVTGPQMFGGYLDPRDDTGRFLVHDGARWYRTGDRVVLLPGGDLGYVGRLDQQTKVRGYRVELLEVENALRQLDGVADCAVVPVRFDGETALAAIYSGDPAVAVALPRRLSATLPGYMIPAFVNHVPDLPVNSNGKTDRPLLADWVERNLAKTATYPGSD